MDVRGGVREWQFEREVWSGGVKGSRKWRFPRRLKKAGKWRCKQRDKGMSNFDLLALT